MRTFVHDALPGRVVFGVGSLGRVADEVTAIGAERVLLIADGRAKAIADDLAGQLGDRVAARLGEVVQRRSTAAGRDAIPGPRPDRQQGGSPQWDNSGTT